MEKYTVYIITDSNRTYLETGMCTDVHRRLAEIKDASSILFAGTSRLNNMVYTEHYENKEQAEAREMQLKHFTRMQRERLVRSKNPNWLNLSVSPALLSNKKVVVYA
ncbi:GIY-YIG nuclease family protein [Sphingobacterium paludis]|jgi:putative endonuclease|uniref:Putative endonuclease n=1 Tax=Sphingobacterium paludis TaxID=1476465 RepID=A0A4R7CY45_9SPHI|nr:GIY-YIG nuclease family protein [Sphingobacterium paludis]TDS13230.1 putative endonuclease [Sphingobacterium paludis]